jgi:2-methylisocitrate lyase-like PEP mutase family enzyme
MLAEATQLPILVDGDTGYGNFNNVRRLVRKLCERHIAGVCIEDKLYSFISGKRLHVASVGSGKAGAAGRPARSATRQRLLA